MALGAGRRDVIGLVMKDGLSLALGGVVIGLAAAFALTHLLSSLLFGVTAADPGTLAAVSVVLCLVALLACYVPARRAAQVEPMVALRVE
jgi:putative ABC transport system permease protein